MEISPANKPSRLPSLDIAKGIGIILVVWAHAKGPFSSYIYQFHMPFFFLISGYLFNPKPSFWQFARRKLSSLYFPFALWNSLAVFMKASQHSLTWSRALCLETQILLTLNKDGQFFGATWFLGSLFVVSLVYKLLDASIQECRFKRIFITLFFACIAIIGFEIDFPFMLSRTFILSMFYAVGYLIKEYQEEWKAFDTPMSATASFLLFLLIGHYNSANMGANSYKYHFSFVLGALLASYAVMFFSKALAEKAVLPAVGSLQKLLCYLGKESINIVIWQFVAFRFIIALQLYFNHIPFDHLLKYYPVYDANHFWWIAYLAAGVVIPILWGKILKSFCSHPWLHK